LPPLPQNYHVASKQVGILWKFFNPHFSPPGEKCGLVAARCVMNGIIVYQINQILVVIIYGTGFA